MTVHFISCSGNHKIVPTRKSHYCAVLLLKIISNTRASEFYEAQGFRQGSGMVEPFELAGVTLLEQRYFNTIKLMENNNIPLSNRN